MAAYRSWAQTVIRLDFYEKPVQHFCNSCQEKLCAECVPIHVNEKPFMSHDVLFRNRVFSTECELHEGQRCQVQGRQSASSAVLVLINITIMLILKNLLK